MLATRSTVFLIRVTFEKEGVDDEEEAQDGFSDWTAASSDSLSTPSGAGNGMNRNRSIDTVSKKLHCKYLQTVRIQIKKERSGLSVGKLSDAC